MQKQISSIIQRCWALFQKHIPSAAVIDARESFDTSTNALIIAHLFDLQDSIFFIFIESVWGQMHLFEDKLGKITRKYECKWKWSDKNVLAWPENRA